MDKVMDSDLNVTVYYQSLWQQRYCARALNLASPASAHAYTGDHTIHPPGIYARA